MNRAVPMAIVALAPALAHASSWADVRFRAEEVLRSAVTQAEDPTAAVSWHAAHRALKALDAGCEATGGSEFTRRTCEAELPVLREKLHAALGQPVRYSAQIGIELGEFDFDRGIFPLRRHEDRPVRRTEPAACATAVVPDSVCLFTEKPTQRTVRGTIHIPASVMPPWTGEVVTLRADEPEPLTLGPLPVEQAERVREEATDKVSADLRFTWPWAPDRCAYQPARPFGSGDSSPPVPEYCWGEVQVLGLEVSQPVDLARLLNGATP